MHLDELKGSSVEMVCMDGTAKVEGGVVLPAPENMGDWSCPERNGHDTTSQMRGLETILVARRNGRGPDSSLKRCCLYV